MEQLNSRQTEAVEYFGSPLLVLAGAGSGKTKVLTLKIVRTIETGYVKPWQILAMTFTNKAANEMRERIRKLLPGCAHELKMGTFHSVCAWILRREAEHLGLSENYTIYDADDQKTLIRRILKKSRPTTRITPSSAKSYISKQKNDGISVDEAEEAASTKWETEIAEIYRTYCEELEKAGALDFDDLLTQVLILFRQNSDTLKYYRNRFRYIFVDEYQDTNHVQHELLKIMTDENSGICVVGDDDQSIYGWRGACVANILEFEKDFPGTKIIRLEENYRSCGNILKGASSLVMHNVNRHGKTLWTRKDEGTPIKVQALFNEVEEAEWILQKVIELRNDDEFNLNSIAVLYRTNAQSRLFETACRKFKIPYEVVGSQRFYERVEIKDVIAYLRVLLNHQDRLSLDRIINKPPRGLGQKGRNAFFSYVDLSGGSPIDAMLQADSIDGISTKSKSSLKALGEWYKDTAEIIDEGASASDIVGSILEISGIVLMYDSNDIVDQSRLENLSEFMRSVVQYDKDVPEGGLQGFMNEISLATTVDEYDGTDVDKMVIMTLHCSKGLEYDAVFIAGLEEGLLPFVRQGEYAPKDTEEERRLLYVGMTRAKERLFLTYVVNRNRGGVQQSGPSRFLGEIAAGNDRIKKTPAITQSRKTPVEKKERPKIIYRKGNIIEHPRYGQGLVIKAIRRQDQWQITVDFGFDEPKTLITGYVPIPVIK